MVNKDLDRLSATLHALSDPTRRAILARLARGESAVGELAQPFDMTLPAISKHLKVLEEAGVVVRAVEGRTHRLALNTAALGEAADWMDRQRALWERMFDVVDEFIEEQKEKT
jgi:DNA-binding transcriptional ArsR family regulator